MGKSVSTETHKEKKQESATEAVFVIATRAVLRAYTLDNRAGVQNRTEKGTGGRKPSCTVGVSKRQAWYERMR